MNISSDNQQRYFDDASHRYPDVVDPPFAQRLEMEHLERALGKTPGKNIMDFGAGSGRVTCWFLKKGYNVTAVDISQKSLSDLTRLFRRHRKPSWGILKTATKLPKSEFDAIVGADILHHVSLNTYLPKLYRTLKSDGRIAFSEPNAWHLPWYIHWYIERIPWEIERGALQCTLINLQKQLHRAHFSDVTIAGHGLFPTRLLEPFSSLCRFNALQLGGYLKPFAFRFIITARK